MSKTLLLALKLQAVMGSTTEKKKKKFYQKPEGAQKEILLS